MLTVCLERYDYFPGPSPQLVVRMPLLTHEIFAQNVVTAIQTQLDKIREEPENSRVRDFTASIVNGGSSNIKLHGGATEESYLHMPDAQFHHKEAQYPGVVLEVSYSQKRKDLPKLADNYIVDSEGSIKVVIGLDIEYRGSRKATVSIWRPKYELQDNVLEISSREITHEVFMAD